LCAFIWVLQVLSLLKLIEFVLVLMLVIG
jgi:hypothetical protein